LNAGVRFGTLGTELFFANLKDFARGGTLFGIRPTYRVSKAFPLTIGANFIIDVNQFGGLKDNDKDYIPNIFDDFPDDAKYDKDSDGDGTPDDIDPDRDGNGYTDWIKGVMNDLGVDSATAAGYINEPDLAGIENRLKADPFSTEDNKARAIGFAVDVGYPVFSNKIVNLMVYSEFNMLNFPGSGSPDGVFYRPDRSGTGITIPGIRAQLFKIVNLNFEYRIKRDYFVPQFFDQSYDVSRVVPVYTGDQTIIFTKDRLLFDQENSNVAQNGYFGSAGVGPFRTGSVAGFL